MPKSPTSIGKMGGLPRSSLRFLLCCIKMGYDYKMTFLESTAMSRERPASKIEAPPEDKGRGGVWVKIIVALIGAIAIIAASWTPFIAPHLFPSATPTGVVTSAPTPSPTPIPSPPLLVQSNFGAAAGGTNAVQLGGPGKPVVGKGDLILVAITQFERAVTNLKDSQGDPYTKVGGTLANPDDRQDYVELYYFQNVIGGPATTITVTFSKFTDQYGGDTNVGVYEYTGLSATSPQDDADTNTSNKQLTKTLKAGKQLTVSENNELCFAVGVDSGFQGSGSYSDTIAAGQGYKLLYPATSHQAKADDAKSQERFYTEAAPVQQGGCIPNFSIAYSSFWAIISVALKP